MKKSSFVMKQVDKAHFVLNNIALIQNVNRNSRPNDNAIYIASRISEIDEPWLQENGKFFFKVAGCSLKVYCWAIPPNGQLDVRDGEIHIECVLKIAQKLYGDNRNLDDPYEIEYNGIKIMLSHFRDSTIEKFNEIFEKSGTCEGINVNLEPSPHANSGIQNEVCLKNLIDEAVKFAVSRGKPLELAIREKDTGREKVFNNAVWCEHVGQEGNNVWDLADLAIHMADGSKELISLKTEDSEELTSERRVLLTMNSGRQFLNEALNLTNCIEIVENSGVRNKKEWMQYRIVKFVNGCTGIAMRLPKKDMERILFGEGTTKCSTLIAHSFTVVDRKAMKFEELSNKCCVTITVSKLMLTVDDAVERGFEPWLFLRKRGRNTAVLYQNVVYKKVLFCAVKRSRVFTSDDEDVKKDIYCIKQKAA